ncbi:MAG: hypothetical protein ACP5LF_02880 [Nitrososphaeria archaeon]|nr:hypothetical protein [Conexivisphaerales archaeon]
MKAGDKKEINLTDLEKKILVHILKYGPDNAWLMARRLLGISGWRPSYSEDEIEAACLHLESLGLLQKYNGSLKWLPTSSIKPWIKFKQRNRDKKPKGIYFDLTKEGKKLAKQFKNS